MPSSPSRATLSRIALRLCGSAPTGGSSGARRRGPWGAVHQPLPAVAPEQPAHHRDRRRLAGAVRPEQTVRLPRPDLEADAVDGSEIAEALPQLAALEDRLAHWGAGVPGDPKPVGLERGRSPRGGG